MTLTVARPTYLIRTATPDDRAAVIALGMEFAQSISATPYVRMFTTNEQSVGAIIDVALEAGVIHLADVEGVIAGMFVQMIVTHPFSGERYAEELAWWVSPEYRSGRVGPLLMKAAIEWARTQGAKMLKMGAPAGSDVGVFYERQGFVPLETVYGKVL